MPDEFIWAMFFQGVVSIKLHPRNSDVDRERVLDEAMDTADLMLQAFHRRFACPSFLPPRQ